MSPRPFRTVPKVPTCEFCGAEISDPMLGFLDHIESSAACRSYWTAWRENVKRESGGT